MRVKLRGRTMLPGLVVVGVAIAGLLTSGAAAGAGSSSAGSSSAGSPTAGSSTAGSSTAGSSTAGSSTAGSSTNTSSTNTSSTNGTPGAGTAYGSSVPTPSSGSTQAIKTTSPITYHLPPSSYIPAGQLLFQQNCASCHGTDAYGTDRAPNLVGLGAATVDFWVSTGRMPLAISAIQAMRKPPRFDRQKTLEIVAYVTSLTPSTVTNGPAIPSVDTAHASLANGNTLFVLNCAACHTITGAGDALAEGYFAPSLHKASSTQIVEAMRTGPGNMPRFSPGTLTDKQVADIAAYVRQYIQRPDNRGGLGLGGIGPVAEGFIALLIGVGGLMLVAFWIGDRA